MSFSSDIKKVRQKSLLSQEAFAQAVGVSFTTVNRWESGKCKPTFKTMKLIDDFCKAKGIDSVSYTHLHLLMVDDHIPAGAKLY